MPLTPEQEDEIAAERGLTRPTRRATVPALEEILYAPLAESFVRRFPRVQLELSEGLTEVMSDRLLRAELDLAIVTAPQPNDHLDYETLVVEQVLFLTFGSEYRNVPSLASGKLTLLGVDISAQRLLTLGVSVAALSLLWLFIHLIFLVEFENRLLVLVQWAWNYFTRNRSARLITGEGGPLPPEAK